jgi:hypothetical protein
LTVGAQTKTYTRIYKQLYTQSPKCGNAHQEMNAHKQNVLYTYDGALLGHKTE